VTKDIADEKQQVGLLEPKYGPDGIKTKATAAASLRARENANPANPVTQKA
jgi:hypothetical protein